MRGNQQELNHSNAGGQVFMKRQSNGEDHGGQDYVKPGRLHSGPGRKLRALAGYRVIPLIFRRGWGCGCRRHRRAPRSLKKKAGEDLRFLPGVVNGKVTTEGNRQRYPADAVAIGYFSGREDGRGRFDTPAAKSVTCCDWAS